MLLNFRHPKTVFTYSTFLSTETASFALWEKASLQGNPYKNKGKVVIFETGTDGNFKVTLNYSQNLTPEEQNFVHKKKKGITLEAEEKVFYLGEPVPNRSSKSENQVFADGSIDKLVLPRGKYFLDIYSLLMRDSDNNPTYLQFVLNLFAHKSYKQKEMNPHYLENNIDLSYS